MRKTQPKTLVTKVPVTIVSGFLGAGKTTLMNRILNDDHGLNIAVMVNDFGAINIDSQLVVSAEQNMVSLANGCICCTVENDLIDQLRKLLNRREGAPDAILIETSGISEPSKVVNTLGYPEFKQRLVIDAVICLLDADQFSDLQGSMKQLAMDQLAVADIVVINKTDLVDECQLQQIKEQWLYPQARLYETQFADVPLALLIGTQSRGAVDVEGHQKSCDKEHCDHSDHAKLGYSEDFSSCSWRSEAPLNLAKLRQALKKLPATVYRAKGFVYLAEAPELCCTLQLVGSRVSIEKNGQWSGVPANQMIMIGQGPLENEVLTTMLDNCRA